jgi:hypothetical protein
MVPVDAVSARTHKKPPHLQEMQKSSLRLYPLLTSAEKEEILSALNSRVFNIICLRSSANEKFEKKFRGKLCQNIDTFV